MSDVVAWFEGDGTNNDVVRYFNQRESDWERIAAAKDITIRCAVCRNRMAVCAVVPPSDRLSAGARIVGTTIGGGERWATVDLFLSAEHPDPVRLFCHRHTVATDENGDQVTATGTLTLGHIMPAVNDWLQTGKRQTVMLAPGTDGQHLGKEFRRPSPNER